MPSVILINAAATEGFAAESYENPSARPHTKPVKDKTL